MPPSLAVMSRLRWYSSSLAVSKIHKSLLQPRAEALISFFLPFFLKKKGGKDKGFHVKNYLVSLSSATSSEVPLLKCVGEFVQIPGPVGS